MHETSSVVTGEAADLRPEQPALILDRPYHCDLGNGFVRVGVRVDQAKQSGRSEDFGRALAECSQSITGRPLHEVEDFDNIDSRSRTHKVGREIVNDQEDQPNHVHMWVHCKEGDSGRYLTALKETKEGIEKDEKRRKLKLRASIGAVVVIGLLGINSVVGSNESAKTESAEANQQKIATPASPRPEASEDPGTISLSQENEEPKTSEAPSSEEPKASEAPSSEDSQPPETKHTTKPHKHGPKSHNQQQHPEVKGPTKLRLASMNIYYSTDHGRPDYSMRQWPQRLARSANVIKSRNIAVAGLQEVRENQWQKLQDKNMLGKSYGIFPHRYNAGGYASQNPIVWNKNRFRLIKGNTIAGPHVTLDHYYKNSNTEVRLKDRKTNQQLVVINTHESVGRGAAVRSRYNSAKKRAQYVSKFIKQGIAVFLTGDWNSKYNKTNPRQPTFGNKSKNLAVNVLTHGTGLRDAYYAARKNMRNTPSLPASSVDHVFISQEVNGKEVKVKNYNRSISPGQAGSDNHKPVLVDVKIPS